MVSIRIDTKYEMRGINRTRFTVIARRTTEFYNSEGIFSFCILMFRKMLFRLKGWLRLFFRKLFYPLRCKKKIAKISQYFFQANGKNFYNWSSWAKKCKNNTYNIYRVVSRADNIQYRFLLGRLIDWLIDWLVNSISHHSYYNNIVIRGMRRKWLWMN